jgi:protein ImuB
MFASIYIPNFAMQTILRQEPSLAGRPVALLDDSLPPQVTEFSQEAENDGVCHGMTSAQAQGRCHALAFRKPGAELLEAARDCLLQCGGALSPWIEATALGLVTLEWRSWPGATGSVDAAAQAAEISAALEKTVSWLASAGFSAFAGAAGNPDLAILAARCARPVLVLDGDPAPFLNPLPLHVLTEDAAELPEMRHQERERAMAVLRRWGIRTLGQLAKLPRAKLIERLGTEAELLWERAQGRSQRLLKLVRVPERFVEMHEFDHQVETLEPLLFLLRRFVEQLCSRLELVHRVVSVLHLRLSFERSPLHERELKVPSPTADMEVLFRMLSTHLEHITAESPVVSVHLEAIPSAPQRSQFDLFSSRLRDPNQFYETLAQLSAMLGADKVGSPVRVDSHRPDDFKIAVPHFDEAPATELGELSTEGLPLRRFRPPAKASVEMYGSRPGYVSSEVASGTVVNFRGPWLSSGEWWSTGGWKRMEWDVQLAIGVFRLVQEAGGASLEGRYE